MCWERCTTVHPRNCGALRLAGGRPQLVLCGAVYLILPELMNKFIFNVCTHVQIIGAHATSMQKVLTLPEVRETLGLASMRMSPDQAASLLLRPRLQMSKAEWTTFCSVLNSRMSKCEKHSEKGGLLPSYNIVQQRCGSHVLYICTGHVALTIGASSRSDQPLSMDRHSAPNIP